MAVKISGALKRLYTYCFRGKHLDCKKCLRDETHTIHNDHIIKLAIVHITPTLRLLSFRVSKNYLYFSFARPSTDLMEYTELCQEDFCSV
ncbi:hypothetical protein KGM_206404 [Danaus plexippus plexippus]|uniref:Uncharacterized protein n=1 Tax=Danaus plexippus plexippus TaxID=278856 RepID=A0A212EJN3_DANPL|nr:hypothetical protein KGM_206404 [Danaus plexippus plexippus]